MLLEFLHNLSHSLFKPLLLFFYAGFLIPLFRVKFEFPKPVYQGLTIYLLLAIGWHGGKELAMLPISSLGQALGLCAVGFVTNTIIGLVAYKVLRTTTRLRQIDAATVAGYYGSDSAGTFVTAMGMLTAAHVAYAPYMPVLLAVMEIPGCIVALAIVSRMRTQGMDIAGNMPGEAGYIGQKTQGAAAIGVSVLDEEPVVWKETENDAERKTDSQIVGSARRHIAQGGHGDDSWNSEDAAQAMLDRFEDEELEAKLSLESDRPSHAPGHRSKHKSGSWIQAELLHEVFFNPGIYLLFTGIAIGFISRLQGEKVTLADDALFDNLFQGILCLFLLEMGMTAASKLKDIGVAGWQFAAFGLIAPNVFALTGIGVLHAFSTFLGQPFETGSYVLFAVLCGAASYIALPAVQRMAIPEASPTLPLAASLGLTFSYNVTIGIPLYLMIAEKVTTAWPIGSVT
ncbi:MAG: sodium-dependent bicarbonate transport family permease [Planctomycetaceae bacterium]|nr:sodium-dependent bicarbonate transport family permease [Planctomycetaceae bacterium]